MAAVLIVAIINQNWLVFCVVMTVRIRLCFGQVVNSSLSNRLNAVVDSVADVFEGIFQSLLDLVIGNLLL